MNFISGFWAGMIGFLTIILFDLNNVTKNNERLESLYPAGAGLLGLGILMELPNCSTSLAPVLRIILGVAALAALAAVIYCTFAVGARYSWQRPGKATANARWWEIKLCDTGVYAICRHPVVWCWVVFLLCLTAAVGFPWLYTIIYSVAGILLALYEDRSVFPRVMPGYDAYKKQTPFLFPNSGSVQRCKETWGRKK